MNDSWYSYCLMGKNKKGRGGKDQLQIRQQAGFLLQWEVVQAVSRNEEA
jgi:hypothetical protein